MKKIIVLLLAFVLALPAINAAELSKKDQKMVENLAKKRAKDLEKQGWKTMGTLPLVNSLTKHFTATEFDGLEELQGISTRTKSKNNGRMLAQSNAMNTYAGEWESKLKGRIAQELKVEESALNSNEFEHFYGAFERLVEGEIRGELKESFSMIRENPDGTFEIQIFYLIDPDKATTARMNALTNAMKESELSQQYAEKISEFINNGF